MTWFRHRLLVCQSILSFHRRLVLANTALVHAIPTYMMHFLEILELEVLYSTYSGPPLAPPALSPGVAFAGTRTHSTMSEEAASLEPGVVAIPSSHVPMDEEGSDPVYQKLADPLPVFRLTLLLVLVILHRLVRSRSIGA